MGYTFEQLQQMGAKPVVNTASLEPKKYTFEELQGLGAKPIENPFKFDVVETQQAKIERLRADADLAMKKAKKANSFLNTYVRGTMDAILPGTTNLGDTLGGLATDKFVRKNYETATSNLKDSNLKLQQTIYKLEKEGKDTTKLKQLYNSNVDTLDSLEKQYKDATEGVEGKSVGNVAGEVGLTGLSVLTAGTYGKAKSPVPSVIENARNILPKSTGLFTKEGAKNVVMGATKATPVGYGFDVTMGMAGMRGEDREGVKSLIPGVGTAIAPVLGAAIPALTEGTQSVKNVFNKELRKNNTVSKVADEIFNVQNNYSKTRKFNNALADEGKASRERVASSGVLQGSVNTDGSISTKTKGGAIDQYKKATVDGGEGVVYDILKEEGATAEITKIENNLLKNIQESNLTLDEVESATNNVEKIIKQFKQKYPSGKVPLADLQLEKIKTTQNIDYTNTSSKIRQKAIGRAYKELVEDNSALNIKEINSKVLQPYYDDLTLLENLDGRKVKGGKLGKYFSQISGNIIGGIAGNAVGGPAGSAIGTIVGGELGGRIRGSIMSKSFSGNIDSVLKKSPILEKAQNYKKSLPAKISGVDYNVKPSGNKYAPIELPAQLNRSGNRNQRYNPTAIDNSIAPNNAISTTLPQKVEKAIVKKDLTSLKEYNAEITKQIDKFRKEAGLMASNEGAGVRQYVSDQTGGEDRIYNSFKLSRAKSDMHKRAESAKKYAQEMMYENDPDFRELVDKRDQLLNNKIDTSTNEIDVKAIFDDISREESKINEANKELAAFKEFTIDEAKSFFKNEKNNQAGFVKNPFYREPKLPEAKSATKSLPTYKGEKDLTTKILKDLEGKTTVSKQYILDATNRGELKQVERDLIRDILERETGGNIPASQIKKEMGEYLGYKNSDTFIEKEVPLSKIKNKDTLESFGGRETQDGSEIVELMQSIRKNGFKGRIVIDESGKVLDGNHRIVALRELGIKNVPAYVKSGSDTINVSDFAKKVKAELLPLKRTGGTSAKDAMNKTKYENISLPEDLRGDVKNYGEVIYESPIKTSAGQTHFSGQSENYFGHTRIEDMADNKTRRVIEVQSDLYQKGNLEKETSNLEGMIRNDAERLRQHKEGMNPNYSTPEQLKKEIASKVKLQQYNDPTAHFRMIREEIKKASQDGKTKLQFPTGETAMKIEGLGEGQRDIFNQIGSDGRGLRVLTPDVLKIGGEIEGNGGRWIITDVLGDGKFKAVPKSRYEMKTNEFMNGEELAKMKDAYSEQFDISGKVDTNNPIYKFYEKDVQKYLNKFGGRRVKDNQGVEWIEVPINKEQGKKPVEAFGMLKLRGINFA